MSNVEVPAPLAVTLPFNVAAVDDIDVTLDVLRVGAA
jgi:hypothetical protein